MKVPGGWNNASVSPIFRKGKKEDLGNYRLVKPHISAWGRWQSTSLFKTFPNVLRTNSWLGVVSMNGATLVHEVQQTKSCTWERRALRHQDRLGNSCLKAILAEKDLGSYWTSNWPWASIVPFVAKAHGLRRCISNTSSLRKEIPPCSLALMRHIQL